MNSNKKSTPASGVPRSFNRPAGSAHQLKPSVAQLKTGVSAQSGKRPVAPPVYHPKQAPKIVQTKVATDRITRLVPNFRGAVQQTVRRPVAPPVYRPEVKKIVQPKMISPQAKIANSVQPITAKSTAFPFRAIQMAEEKPRKACDAVVVAKSGATYDGAYKNGIHAEIQALENYFSSGGTVANITRIEISSQPCKYCHLILSDLGIRKKVQTDDDRDFGSCSGGSYGWFKREGAVWQAIVKVTGYTDMDEYIDYVIERQRKL